MTARPPRGAGRTAQCTGKPSPVVTAIGDDPTRLSRRQRRGTRVLGQGVRHRRRPRCGGCATLGRFVLCLISDIARAMNSSTRSTLAALCCIYVQCSVSRRRRSADRASARRSPARIAANSWGGTVLPKWSSIMDTCRRSVRPHSSVRSQRRRAAAWTVPSYVRTAESRETRTFRRSQPSETRTNEFYDRQMAMLRVNSAVQSAPRRPQRTRGTGSGQHQKQRKAGQSLRSGPLSVPVELPGIEPGSYGIPSRLLRAQFAMSLLGSLSHANKPR